MSSRLIVKGLPRDCTESKLRSIFDKYGDITDCTLKYTKDGKFRNFAFVGFSDKEDAARVINDYNGAFIGSSRITVETCRPFGDETKPRSWSKYAKGSSAFKRAHPDQAENSQKKAENIVTSKNANQAIDDDFERFLEVRNKSTKHSQEFQADSIETVNTDDLVEELLQEITGDTSLSVLICGLPSSIKQASLKSWLVPARLKGLKIVRNKNVAAAFVTFLNRKDAKKALARSGEFLYGSKVTVKEMPNSFIPNKADYSSSIKEQQTEVQNVVDAILETGRLFLRNLPYTCSEDDICFLFKKYGELADVQFIVDKKTNRSKGFAVITYVFPENAVAAYSALDGTIFKGRMLHILPGDEKKENKMENYDSLGAKSTFQKEKAAKLKANAGKAHSWNTLFLGANAIADTLAAKLDVEKSDLLSSEGETSAGVRLALAETRLVRETRDFLLSQGVCLDAFSRPAAKRSNTVIIVKNLPANVDVEELERMFGRFGHLNKTVMPPGGVTAIIEMGNTADARQAFNALAYSRFRSQPLYLEWAPIDVFQKQSKLESGTSGLAVDAENETVRKRGAELTQEEKKQLRRSKRSRIEEFDVNKEEIENSAVNRLESETLQEESPVVSQNVDEKKLTESESEEAERGPGLTVFVKNLNFSTTEESLKHKFASKYKVQNATISKKLGMLYAKDPSVSLSMGFGFVQFYHAKDAQDAIKTMQGVLLDGHCLELKLSNRDDTVDQFQQRKEVSDLEQKERTKIHIKNIAFQASRKEVKQLFATFGELKAFRMPRKAGGSKESHRGFGFVDYLTRADARRAFNELVHSTHLYGKRLVLEWAKADDSVDELREKAINNFSVDKKETKLRKKKLKEIEKDLAAIDAD